MRLSNYLQFVAEIKDEIKYKQNISSRQIDYKFIIVPIVKSQVVPDVRIPQHPVLAYQSHMRFTPRQFAGGKQRGQLSLHFIHQLYFSDLKYKSLNIYLHSTTLALNDLST